MMDGMAQPPKGHIFGPERPCHFIFGSVGGEVITLSWPTAALGNCTRQKMTCPGMTAFLIMFLELKVTLATAAIRKEGGGRKVNQSSIWCWRRWCGRLISWLMLMLTFYLSAHLISFRFWLVRINQSVFQILSIAEWLILKSLIIYFTLCCNFTALPRKQKLDS